MLNRGEAHFEGVRRSYFYDVYRSQRELKTYFGRKDTDFVLNSGIYYDNVLMEDDDFIESQWGILLEVSQACRDLNESLNHITN